MEGSNDPDAIIVPKKYVKEICLGPRHIGKIDAKVDKEYDVLSK